MKSSVMNVQVDVTFYKKTFLFFALYFSFFFVICCMRVSAELKCVAMWHYYWQYYYHQLQLSVCVWNRMALLLRIQSFFSSFGRRLQYDDAGAKYRSLAVYGTHKCCHQFFLSRCITCDNLPFLDGNCVILFEFMGSVGKWWIIIRN